MRCCSCSSVGGSAATKVGSPVAAVPASAGLWVDGAHKGLVLDDHDWDLHWQRRARYQWPPMWSHWVTVTMDGWQATRRRQQPSRGVQGDTGSRQRRSADAESRYPTARARAQERGIEFLCRGYRSNSMRRTEWKSPATSRAR